MLVTHGSVGCVREERTMATTTVKTPTTLPSDRAIRPRCGEKNFSGFSRVGLLLCMDMPPVP